MNDIKYRRATIADIDQVIDSRVEAVTVLLGAPVDGEEQILRTELKQYLQYAMPAQQYICWVAKDGENIIGVGGLAVRQHPGNFKNPTGRVGYVMSMYVREQYRRKGIASTILENLIESGREIGIKVFELHASKLGEPVYIKN